jgi:hypothetical protein
MDKVQNSSNSEYKYMYQLISINEYDVWYCSYEFYVFLYISQNCFFVARH